MHEKIQESFIDKEFFKKVQINLPKLFQFAELESSRAGKIGMEVGSVREKIIVALLLYKFGEENVETEIRITEAEVDVRVFGNPISVKTSSGKNLSGIKLIWTVDAEKALKFSYSYKPSCDMIFVQINWDNGGGLFYIPLEVQEEIFKNLGREKYIKLPKIGTNPRGVEMTAEGMRALLNNKRTLKIQVDWKKEKIDFKPFKRWVELWQQD